MDNRAVDNRFVDKLKPYEFWISLGVLIVFCAAFLGVFFFHDVPALRKIALESSPPPPPSVISLEGVSYDTETHYVSGTVEGAEEPAQYGVIVFIHAGREHFPKPYADSAIQKVNDDGSFYVQAYSANEEADMGVDRYSVLLVDKNLNYSALVEQAAGDDEPAEAWDLARELAIDELWDLPTYN